MLPLIVVAAGLIAGQVARTIGKNKADGKRKTQDEIYKDIISDFEKMPPAEQEKFAEQQLGPSEFAKLKASPALQDAQMRALAQFDEIQDAGGLTLADQAAQNKLLNKSARAEASGRNAIQQNMAARGTLGSGSELAMSLANAQASADRGNQNAMDTAAQAQNRVLDSIMAEGNMATGMRTQDFGEKSAKARAADEIARYNAQAIERGQIQRNAQNQQAYENKFRQTSAAANVKGSRAKLKGEDADRTQQQWNGYGNAATQLGTTFAGGMGGGGGMPMGGGTGSGTSALTSAPTSYAGPMSSNAPAYDGGFDEEGYYRGGY